MKTWSGGSKTNYAEKLRDPRWQQTRLRIFERDRWQCQLCGRTDRSLCVHHIAYMPGDPWDTCDPLLITLCELCHDADHEFRRLVLPHLFAMLAGAGIRTSSDLFRLCAKVASVMDDPRVTDQNHETVTRVALGIAIQDWGDDKAAMLADGTYWSKR